MNDTAIYDGNGKLNTSIMTEITKIRAFRLPFKKNGKITNLKLVGDIPKTITPIKIIQKMYTMYPMMVMRVQLFLTIRPSPETKVPVKTVFHEYGKPT